jgi:hypothetical protein
LGLNDSFISPSHTAERLLADFDHKAQGFKPVGHSSKPPNARLTQLLKICC